MENDNQEKRKLKEGVSNQTKFQTIVEATEAGHGQRQSRKEETKVRGK